MIDFNTCKNPDGTTDWKKYHELQVKELEEQKAKGEICQRKDCNRHVMFSRGYPKTCSDCNALDDSDELHHPSNVRCPKCGDNWSVWEGDSYRLYEEGDHQVDCHSCGYKFEVNTSISYSFQSPEMIKEEENDEASNTCSKCGWCGDDEGENGEPPATWSRSLRPENGKTVCSHC